MKDSIVKMENKNDNARWFVLRCQGNEILIGKPMPLKMDQGYPGHWTVRDAANVCHTEWSSGGAAEFYGWKYSTVVPASHSGFEFSARIRTSQFRVPI